MSWSEVEIFLSGSLLCSEIVFPETFIAVEASGDASTPNSGQLRDVVSHCGVWAVVVVCIALSRFACLPLLPLVLPPSPSQLHLHVPPYFGRWHD